MAFSADSDNAGGFNEPNVVPLVDVMLVLLIIFMVTASVSQNVRVELPKASVDERPPSVKVTPITITVREAGTVFWGDEELASKDALDARLAVEAQKTPQPEVLLRGAAFLLHDYRPTEALAAIGIASEFLPAEATAARAEAHRLRSSALLMLRQRQRALAEAEAAHALDPESPRVAAALDRARTAVANGAGKE